MIRHTPEPGHAAVVAGLRTPFARIGTALREVHVTELARATMQEVLYRTGFSADALDEVVLGNVVMPADATNPARVAALYAGIPEHVPAFTVQRNCASGMEAIGQAASRIATGDGRAFLAGGAESMSTIPLVLPTETLEVAGSLMKAKSPIGKLGALAKLRPRHLRPQAALEMGLTDPVCGLIMGKTGEKLAHEFGISREDQDAFALRSHQRTVEAAEKGYFDEQIVPVYAGDRFDPVTADVGPRAGQSMEALAKLRPFFDRRDGTITVGNACQVTDGAVATLIADADAARAEGLEPLGYIGGYATAGVEPSRMGLGPVFAIDKLLRKTGLDLADIDLFEINEAFAAQVLACIKAMGSETFGREKLGRTSALGEIDPERLNVNGGAIALGHPVGATGARLVLNLLMEMRRRDVERGIAALCVGGGQGAAILLSRSRA